MREDTGYHPGNPLDPRCSDVRQQEKQWEKTGRAGAWPRAQKQGCSQGPGPPGKGHLGVGWKRGIRYCCSLPQWRCCPVPLSCVKPLCWMPPGPAGGREGARPGRCERWQGWRRSDTHPECWFCEDRGSLRLPASPQSPARRPKCPHTEQGSSETQARHTQHSTILGFGASWPSTLFPRSWSAL